MNFEKIYISLLLNLLLLFRKYFANAKCLILYLDDGNEKA